MIEIEKPTITKTIDENYGKFVVEPLERGYGMTLGNALRRILIAEIPTDFKELLNKINIQIPEII